MDEQRLLRCQIDVLKGELARRSPSAADVAGGTDVDYGMQWLRDHVQMCSPAQEILTAVDDSDDSDIIKQAAFEKLIGRVYGLEKRFEDVVHESDRTRPYGKKSWETRVKWDLCGRYDFLGQTSKVSNIVAEYEEAKHAMERDVAFQKGYAKPKDASQPFQLPVD